ncbi:MAG: class I SAM-dependent methyltransferase [Deltaproteobacteria bacterium]|nr:class I SAM-dependent methyltransferase [Deltaproteobacteria bacterium]
MTACRSCGAKELVPVLSLGAMPLANALVPPERAGEEDPRFPLDLVFCAGCTLLQITETVSPEILFRDYRYFSSFSDTMVRHARAIAGRMASSLGLGPKSLAAEIASNDGYLLRGYVDLGIPVLGIEPARNVAKLAQEKGVDTLVDFFGQEVGQRLAAEGRRADVLHANNVMAHVPDINGVVAGIASFLAPKGVFVTESPHVVPMIDHVEFDTIYHEHLFYYSLTAQAALYRRHGLEISDVEKLPIHGGSIRTFVMHADAAKPTDAVKRLLDEEAAWGVATIDAYRTFGERVGRLGAELRARLSELKKAGKSIAAYGAAAKGTTLLNHFGIGRNEIDFVVDRSTEKQGRLVPGVRLPILPPEALVEKKPDYTLLLTWNFADEILAQQKAYRDGGGKFIIPIPEVRIV